MTTEVDNTHGTLTIRRRLQGEIRDVLHVHRATVFPPIGPDLPDTLSNTLPSDQEMSGNADRLIPDPTAIPSHNPTHMRPQLEWADGARVGYVGSPAGRDGSHVDSNLGALHDGKVGSGIPVRPDTPPNMDRESDTQPDMPANDWGTVE